MGLRLNTFVNNEYYHIYNRGNSKQDIFLDDEDRDRFLKLLYLCNSEYKIRFREDIVERKIDAWDFDRGETIVSIGAWVLMSNHYHLYLTPRRFLGGEKESSVSIFLRKLGTAYSMYFNKKYKRVGKLFEGKFKSVLIESDPQAKYVFSYIHLNPVKIIDPLWKQRGVKSIKETINFLNKYKWNSYLDYKDIFRSENKIIARTDFPEYFLDRNIFNGEIFEWITFPKEIPWGNGVGL